VSTFRAEVTIATFISADKGTWSQNPEGHHHNHHHSHSRENISSVLLVIYGLFNDAVSSSHCVALNDRMINAQ
jgi:hypothetical protein